MSEDPTRKLIRQLFGALAEYDKSMLVMKLRGARERMQAKTGKCDGRKGYDETDHGKAVLARIKQLRRKRRDIKPLSFADIADVLNKEGMLTLTGKPWTGGNVTAATRRNPARQIKGRGPTPKPAGSTDRESMARLRLADSAMPAPPWLCLGIGGYPSPRSQPTTFFF